MHKAALAGVVQLVWCHPLLQEVAGWIPDWGACPRCGSILGEECAGGRQLMFHSRINLDVSLSLLPSPFSL